MKYYKSPDEFESNVESYRSKTTETNNKPNRRFESNIESYRSKTMFYRASRHFHV